LAVREAVEIVAQQFGSQAGDVLSEWIIRATGQEGTTSEIHDRLPPVVVRVSIPTGSVDVPPGDCEIRIDFSEPMLDESWSVVEYAPGSAPELTAPPSLSDDGRTLVLRTRLERGRLYACWLNAANHNNFRDRDGRPLVPYLVGFQTAV
jgi:hypothetical protein